MVSAASSVGHESVKTHAVGEPDAHSPEHQAQIEAQRAETTPTRRATSAGIEAHLYEAKPVLDHGFVRRSTTWATTRPSCRRRGSAMGGGRRRSRTTKGLIRYLMHHWHSTPFEMCEIKLHVNCRSSWPASGFAAVMYVDDIPIRMLLRFGETLLRAAC